MDLKHVSYDIQGGLDAPSPLKMVLMLPNMKSEHIAGRPDPE